MFCLGFENPNLKMQVRFHKKSTNPKEIEHKQGELSKNFEDQKERFFLLVFGKTNKKRCSGATTSGGDSGAEHALMV